MNDRSRGSVEAIRAIPERRGMIDRCIIASNNEGTLGMIDQKELHKQFKLLKWLDAFAREILEDTINHFGFEPRDGAPEFSWEPQWLVPESDLYRPAVRQFVEEQCRSYDPIGQLEFRVTPEECSVMLLDRIAYILLMEVHNE